MGFTLLDPTNDWQVFDNEETIQYQQKLAGETYGPIITIPNCLRRAQGQSLDDYSQVNEMTWHVWVANMPTKFVPKNQDKITAPSDGSVWIVDNGGIEFATWVTRYRLPCKKLV